ncbi:uncharacterized protein LOC135467084 [Liolophura sinensis]|uniref:uncharacterized protein LOC135467084 n=1 Tax=Liolophura sinensis TaxID=3198878 RepID=UPI00315976E6
MFVTVKFGEDVSEIYNPDCRNDVLLQHIKSKCKLAGTDDVLELSDERGVVKNLRNYPTDYAAEYLRDREILILLRVDGTSSSMSEDTEMERSTFVPLLHGLEDNAEFHDTLNPKADVMSDSKSESRSARRKGVKSRLSKKPSNGVKEKAGKKH